MESWGSITPRLFCKYATVYIKAKQSNCLFIILVPHKTSTAKRYGQYVYMVSKVKLQKAFMLISTAFLLKKKKKCFISLVWVLLPSSNDRTCHQRNRRVFQNFL